MRLQMVPDWERIERLQGHIKELVHSQFHLRLYQMYAADLEDRSTAERVDQLKEIKPRGMKVTELVPRVRGFMKKPARRRLMTAVGQYLREEPFSDRDLEEWKGTDDLPRDALAMMWLAAGEESSPGDPRVIAKQISHFSIALVPEEILERGRQMTESNWNVLSRKQKLRSYWRLSMAAACQKYGQQSLDWIRKFERFDKNTLSTEEKEFYRRANAFETALEAWKEVQASYRKYQRNQVKSSGIFPPGRRDDISYFISNPGSGD